jgi:FtsH-binding integral membrane protein
MSPFIRSFHTERFIFFLFPAFSGHSFSSVTLYVAKTVPNQFFGQYACYYGRRRCISAILFAIMTFIGCFDRFFDQKEKPFMFCS